MVAAGSRRQRCRARSGRAAGARLFARGRCQKNVLARQFASCRRQCRGRGCYLVALQGAGVHRNSRSGLRYFAESPGRRPSSPVESGRAAWRAARHPAPPAAARRKTRRRRAGSRGQNRPPLAGRAMRRWSGRWFRPDCARPTVGRDSRCHAGRWRFARWLRRGCRRSRGQRQSGRAPLPRPRAPAAGQSGRPPTGAGRTPRPLDYRWK